MKNKFGLGDRKVPRELAHLPRFAFTPGQPATHKQAQRQDVAFGIRTIGQLLDEAGKRFETEGTRSPGMRKK